MFGSGEGGERTWARNSVVSVNKKPSKAGMGEDKKGEKKQIEQWGMIMDRWHSNSGQSVAMLPSILQNNWDSKVTVCETTVTRLRTCVKTSRKGGKKK